MKIEEIFNLKEMHAAYKNQDIQKLLSFYSSNAKVVQVVVAEDLKNFFTGHEEIASTYKDLFFQVFDYEYFDENVIVVGDTALYTFSWAELKNGKRKHSNFASWVLRKEADGKWRILIDTYRC